MTVKRRDFIKTTSLAAGGIAMAGPSAFGSATQKINNSIPKWRGFNFLDFFSPRPATRDRLTPEKYLRWMADWGFDFVRVPMAYPSYIKFDRSRNIKPDEVYNIDEEKVELVEELVYMAHKFDLHVSLNLHRGPGYCVNAGFHEPFNLWKDKEAMKAFLYHWEFWAKRFKNVSNEKISFDLLNEPSMREDMNDQHSERSAVPGDLYRELAKKSLKTIRKAKPGAMVVADGNDVGKDVIPEITDLDIAQSCRGYYPGIISHYKASWAFKDIENLPEPKWPGKVGDQYLSREMLEEFYAPWIDLVKQGVGVHCGECGCYNKTPHDVFLAWFGDVLDILTDNGIGYALWNFSGSFGIMDSGRTDVDYEDWYGHKLDRRLLNLLMHYS